MHIEDEDARPVEQTGRAGNDQAQTDVKGSDAFDKDHGASTDTRKPPFAAALALAAAGYELIPLKPRDKVPCDQEWTKRAYDSAEVMRRAVSTGNNIGVRLRPIDLVIDVDPRNGGTESLKRLVIDANLELFRYPHVVTGGGGHHYYLRKHADLSIASRHAAYPGIDFKKAGGQVVAPGSVHPNGVEYQAEFHLVEPHETPDAPQALLELLRVEAKAGTSTAGELSPELLRMALEDLPVEDFRDHGEWLQLMMACHYATGGDGIDEFVEWCTSDPAYADRTDEITRRWRSLTVDGAAKVTTGTLVAILRKYGAQLPRVSPEDDFDVVEQDNTAMQPLSQGRRGKPENSYSNCLAALKMVDEELGLAFDEFAQVHVLQAEKLPWRIDVGREINDDVIRVIRHYLLSACGLEAGKDHVIEALLTLAREHPFHPVRNYLASLTWDGTPRLDFLLTKYAGAEDNDYTRAIGAKTLIAAVRRVRHPGCKFDHVVVLEGPQGGFKSTFVRKLSPRAEWYADPAFGNADSKDAALLLQGVWIIELGEMSVLSKSDVEALKAFVSRGVDKLRRPYERLPVSLPRQCIFIGTTNQSEYLMDQTGNRRFWPVRVGSIDIAALESDLEQLWAEAASREAAGELIELPRELWDFAARQQLERVSEDPWASLLRDYLDGSNPAAGAVGPVEPIARIHTRDLISGALGLNASQQNQVVSRRLRMVMEKQLGWTYASNVRIGSRQGAGYLRPEGVL